MILRQFFYQERGNFLQSLHPAASLTYIAVLFLLSLLFSHPLYLIGILSVAILAIWAAGGLAAWEGYMKVAIWMVVLIIPINCLLSHAGSTVLWQGPELPLFGRLSVSMESICYGAAMGVRLLDIISTFCLYNLIVHPDRLLGLLSRFARKSALAVSLATRLFPVMAASMNNIWEVQQLRGVDFSTGTVKERAGKYSSLFYILLVSSLEDSLQMAEAMQTRAFGCGKRTSYRRDVIRPRDWLCLAGSLFSVATGILSILLGPADYTYYPRLGSLLGNSTVASALAAVLCGLALPAGLSWGWKRWHYLRLKI